jgi:peptide/nickel transport system permease protein
MIPQFIARRIAQGILVVFLLSILSFAIINAAPGDPAEALYGNMVDILTSAERARIDRNLGIDKPLAVRYAIWAGNILKGDLGISYIEGRQVKDILRERIPNTLLLFGCSICLILLFSLLLGLKAGFNEGTWWDKFVSGLSVVFYAIPSFWLAIMAIMFFSVYLGILPSSGVRSIDGSGGPGDLAVHLAMPVAVMVIAHVGAYARFIQEKVKEQTKSHFVTAARANGMDERKLMRGIVKNALVPFINYLGITIPSFFGGSVMIETVFSWTGLGMLSAKAANTRDYPLLMGTVFITGVMVVICIMMTDILMLVVNPALRKQVIR